MKNLLAAAALMTITLVSPASANAESEFCPTVANMAVSLMEARQAGVPLLDLLTALEAFTGTAGKMANRMALEAYEQPLYSTESYQQESITEFGNAMLLSCLKGNL